jgi:hypothetical protein
MATCLDLKKQPLQLESYIIAMRIEKYETQKEITLALLEEYQ